MIESFDEEIKKKEKEIGKDYEVDWTEPENDDERTRIKWLINKIFEIRKKQLMNFDALITYIRELDIGIQVSQKFLTQASDKVSVMKWSAMVKSYQNRKSLCAERRYVIQRMHMEEARLEKELMKVLREVDK